VIAATNSYDGQIETNDETASQITPQSPRERSSTINPGPGVNQLLPFGAELDRRVKKPP
jgi:hypothetical protein